MTVSNYYIFFLSSTFSCLSKFFTLPCNSHRFKIVLAIIGVHRGGCSKFFENFDNNMFCSFTQVVSSERLLTCVLVACPNE